MGVGDDLRELSGGRKRAEDEDGGEESEERDEDEDAPAGAKTEAAEEDRIGGWGVGREGCHVGLNRVGLVEGHGGLRRRG